jgi:hypothetical protein
LAERLRGGKRNDEACKQRDKGFTQVHLRLHPCYDNVPSACGTGQVVICSRHGRSRSDHLWVRLDRLACRLTAIQGDRGGHRVDR